MVLPLPNLRNLELPEFGEPSIEPSIPGSTHEARVALAIARAELGGLDALLVYGDREHLANIAYLTGYDPRFEEALLIVQEGRTPILLAGNEGWGYADLANGRFDKRLWSSFSLLDQPRENVPALSDLLVSAGLSPGMRVGCVGWKYFDDVDGVPPGSIELPAFIVEAVSRTVGPTGRLTNATDIFMNPKDGLRTINDVDQMAQFEFAATFASQCLRNVLFGLRLGMSEIDVARLMRLPGLPHSAHLMLSSGERAFAGLASPSLKIVERGDPFTMALGFWGGLSARAGFVVETASELPGEIEDYAERLVAPYFAAVAAWYESIGIGVRGSDLYAAIHDRIGDPFFGVSLNPGHYIHLDEWVSSPVSAESEIEIASGMALQADIIPATGGPYFTTNAEDGVLIADAELRSEIVEKYPEMWTRIERRREFMIETVGINLKPETLPVSNIPGYLQPFLLSPGLAMSFR